MSFRKTKQILAKFCVSLDPFTVAAGPQLSKVPTRLLFIVLLGLSVITVDWVLSFYTDHETRKGEVWRQETRKGEVWRLNSWRIGLELQ